MCIWDLMRIFMCSHLTFPDCSFQASQVLLGRGRSNTSRGTGSKGTAPPLGSRTAPLSGFMDPLSAPEIKDDTHLEPGSLLQHLQQVHPLLEASSGDGNSFIASFVVRISAIGAQFFLERSQTLPLGDIPESAQASSLGPCGHVALSVPGQPPVLRKGNGCRI